MNTNTPRLIHRSSSIGRPTIWLLAILGLVSSTQAQLTTDQINQQVYARTHNLTDTLVGDTVWQNQDADGDGQKNIQEVIAGTEYAAAGSVIKITSITVNTNPLYLDLAFPTANGKSYKAQGKVTLADANWTDVSDPSPAVVSLIGDGTLKVLKVLKAGAQSFKFFRVMVLDAHSDGDASGVSDWAKRQTGLDPKSKYSNKTTDAFGAPVDDRTFVSNNLGASLENFVTISTRLAESTAMQPDAGNTATDSGSFTITRGGVAALLKPITVNLTISGTAVSGADYTPVPTSVSFLAGQTIQTILVTPITPPSVRPSSMTVTATLAAGSGYAIPATNLSAATVVIYPSGTPSGTGLAGVYYKTASTTYASASNFQAGQEGLSRTDATIDFTSGSGGWGSNSGPTGMVGETDGFYSIRWVGQVQPQYSDIYTFFVNSDDGAVLKVNGVTVINQWSAHSLTEYNGSITLQAGTKYDIQLEYFNNGGTADVHLSWMCSSQSKVIIPSSRLYPTSGPNSQPPQITSAPVAYGYKGVSVTGQSGFTVTASNGPTSFALVSGTLPSGLSFNTATGAITGTPTTVGDYQLVVSATKTGVGTSSASLDIQIFDTGSGYTLEVWQNIAATTNIWDIPVTTTPNITDTLATATTLEDNTITYGNNYGERLSGFITPPTSGNYYFWVSANDSAELWVSNDSEPANKVKRASISGGSATKRQWTATPGQRSPWLTLIGGQKYYFEVLHKGITGASNHISVAWYKDPMGNAGTSEYSGGPAYPTRISTASATASSATTGGVVPGYATWKYFATPITSAPGSLYTASMLPEAAGAKGQGAATLRVSADGTTGTLVVNYAGTTGTKTAWHVHCDAYKRTDGSIGATQGEILFDIDTAVPNPDGSFTWDLTVPPSGTTTADMLEILRQGKAYVNVHTAMFPNGEILGYLTRANGSPTFTPPADPPALTGTEHTTDTGASRFLTQATFGPTAADIAYVKTNGFQTWLTNQFALPASHMSDLVVRQVLNVPYPGSQMWNAWWTRALSAPDQLRQRVAFALSQILVISDVGPLNNNSLTQSSYYDILLDGAFGNFRTILKDTTLHPAMGRYLDMVSNDKGNITTGLHANENFAREINQLFSIGLNCMWPDGSLVMDSKGNLVPTYTQDVITGFSSALCGWSYFQADSGGRLPFNFANPSTAIGNPTWITPMKLTRYHHELGAKLLLDNVVLPPISGYPQTDTEYMNTTGGYLLNGTFGSIASGSPSDINTGATYSYTDPAHSTNPAVNYNRYDVNGILDLDAAVENIFQNRNVGPFICRQLIQRLVTSSPSPAYLYRVVRAFNGEKNVQGVRTNVRGDMKDVIQAILLDYEARSNDVLVSANFSTYGKQREPVLRVTAAGRYFGSTTPPFDGTYSQTSGFVIDSGSVVRPVNRIKITTASPHRLVANDVINLQFDTNGSTVGSLPVNGGYTVRVAVDATNFVVETKDLAQAYYSWNGTTITVVTNGINNTLNTGMDVGNTCYLSFMPQTSGGTTPTSGEYIVTAVATTATTNDTLTMVRAPGGVTGTNDTNPGATITGTQALGPFCVIPRQTSGVSYQYFANNTTAKVNYGTGISHNLVTGDFVYLDNSGVLQGRRQVTVQDPFNFTVQIPLQSGSTTTTGMVVYELKAPQLDRSGGAGSPVAVKSIFNTFNMGLTDSESTTASIGQTPLRAQTVFNYFFPDYQFPGTLASAGATTPEFQMTSESGTMLLTNAIEQGILVTRSGSDLTSFKNNGGAIVLDLAQTMPAGLEQAGVNLINPFVSAGNVNLTSNAGIPLLVDLLNHHLAGGNISAATKAQIVNFVTSASPNYFPYTYVSGTPSTTQLQQMRDRCRAVVHLILTSPEYAIQK